MTQLSFTADSAAARHILDAPSIRRRVEPYLYDDGIDWRGLIAEAEEMSGGESLLVRLAHDLSEAGSTAAVWEIPRRLDLRNFERVLEALTIASTGLPAEAVRTLTLTKAA
jgi:hypothetical protein